MKDGAYYVAYGRDLKYDGFCLKRLRTRQVVRQFIFYEIGKEKSFNSVCFYSDDFLNLVRRYFYFKGDERGKKAKNGKKYEKKFLVIK